jgi:putative restriction endonuclease
MNAYIANTDYNWYKYLSSKKDLDEANFWRPTGNAPLATLSQGEPLFFKLKKDYGNRIVGFGHQRAPYAQINHHSPPNLNHEIGCILLTSPIFLPEEMWIQGPNDWSFNLPSGKYYDTTEYAYQQCDVTKEHSIPARLAQLVIPTFSLAIISLNLTF